MTLHERLTVTYDYPVVFTRGLFEPENPVLVRALARLGEDRRHRALVYVDEQVLECHRGLAQRISAYFDKHQLALAAPPISVPGGEAAKNDFRRIEAMVTTMLEQRLDRHSFVIAVGGGAVLDAVGFAAALAHRGLRLVRVPTTVLSQNDGGVGVKNGINFAGVKNGIGTFAPPFCVLNDSDFLLSLPDREWRSGISEAFKVALIRDSGFFDFLTAHAAALRKRVLASMQELVQRCAQLHLAHIASSGDPFEMGRARPLDFGHWSAHKLEMLSDFRISHGEAVAVGILLDSCYAVGKEWLDEGVFERLHAGLKAAGLPVWLGELEDPRLFDGLREFQEHLGGELCVTFPHGLGSRLETDTIDRAAMEAAIARLRELRP